MSQNSYPYPTPEQIHKDDPNAYSSHEVDLYHSAHDKLIDANNRTTPAMANRGQHADAHLTVEEQTAWDKYTDDLMVNWKAPVAGSTPTWQQDGQDPNYHKDTNYTGLNGGATAPELPPPVAGGEDGKGADLIVNTEAIKTFRGNLEKLHDILLNTQTKVEAMPPIKPGYFGLGGSMYRAIIGTDGAPGLQKNTGDFLHSTVTTFEKLMADIDKMILDYDTAEELSTLSAEKLNKAFEDAFTAMGNLGSPTA